MNGPLPDTERLARLQQQLQQDWKPVRPVGSVAQSAALLLVLFLATTVAIPARLGTAGFDTLQPGQMALYYGLIAALALVFAPAVIRRFRPGALVKVNAGLVGVLALLLLAVLVLVLFPKLDVQHFTAGLRCLILGTVSGLVASLFFSLALRRGLAPNPVHAATVTGFFSGLCGIGVLAINCAVLTTPHIFAWHLTVLLVTSAAGAVIGWILARVR